MDDNPYDAGARMLLRRPHSSRELGEKLSRKGYADSQIQAALERLQQENHLNDAELARQLVRWHIAHRPSGKRAVHQRLLVKGLPKELVEAALNELLTTDVEKTCADQALASRLQRSDLKNLSPAKRRVRLARFLLSRGFDTGLVIELLDSKGLRVEV